jgi:hypothetical protein
MANNINGAPTPLRHVVVNMQAPPPPPQQQPTPAAPAPVSNADYDVFAQDGASCARRLEESLCDTFNEMPRDFCVETWATGT